MAGGLNFNSRRSVRRPGAVDHEGLARSAARQVRAQAKRDGRNFRPRRATDRAVGRQHLAIPGVVEPALCHGGLHEARCQRAFVEAQNNRQGAAATVECESEPESSCAMVPGGLFLPIEMESWQELIDETA